MRKDNKDVVGAGKTAITKRQFLAFHLVYGLGLSQAEAAKKMGITQQSLCGLLKKVKKRHPDCIPNTNKPKLNQYQDWMDDKVAEKW